MASELQGFCLPRAGLQAYAIMPGVHLKKKKHTQNQKTGFGDQTQIFTLARQAFLTEPSPLNSELFNRESLPSS